MSTAPWAAGPTPDRIDVGTLQLRRPEASDAEFFVRLHRDPRTSTHAPEAMAATDGHAQADFDAVLAQWEAHGFGYFVAWEGDAPVGVCGVRHHRTDDVGDHLTLHYRLTPDVGGRGVGRLAARAVVEWAVEFAPDLPLLARMKADHTASARVAQASGLFEWREGVDRILRTPTVERFTAPPADDVVDDLLRLWTEVTAHGGAVGFPPGTPAQQIAPTLDSHLASMAADELFLLTLRSPDGELVGFSWWHRSKHPLLQHMLELKRFQVSPHHRRRHLGRLLLTSMHRWARDFDGIEALHLDYRSGLGTGDFYAGSGYVEVGRLPGMLQPTPGDFRDSVAMMRRLDGLPLRFDGRS